MQLASEALPATLGNIITYLIRIIRLDSAVAVGGGLGCRFPENEAVRFDHPATLPAGQVTCAIL